MPKISALPQELTAHTTDIIPIVDETVVPITTKYVTVAALLALVPASPGGAWGNVVEKNANYTAVVADKGTAFVMLAPATSASLPLNGTGCTATDAPITFVNATGAAIAIGGNGLNIYPGLASETIADGESRTYKFNPGAVSGVAKWMRVA